MFKLAKNDMQLSFTVEREISQFGDGTRVLFWIDRDLEVLQRGRQEYIPIASIVCFRLGNNGHHLVARLGSNEMLLYEGTAEEIDELREAVVKLNEYCGLSGDCGSGM